MNTITTKYDVGDVVWFAHTVIEQKSHPCPDCLGERKWVARSPAGGEYKFDCPRCSKSYLSDNSLRLDYPAYTPQVQKLTVGQVLAVKGGDEKTRYMCLETGVGSGSLYDEERLFPTSDDALLYAGVLAEKANANVPQIVQQYDKSLRVCDYQIEMASARAAEDNLRQYKYAVGDLLEELLEGPPSSIKDVIEAWRNR